MAGCRCRWAGVRSTSALSLLTHDLTHDATLDHIHEARAGTYAEPLAEDLDRTQEVLRRALDADSNVRSTHTRWHETGRTHRDRRDDHDHDG